MKPIGSRPHRRYFEEREASQRGIVNDVVEHLVERIHKDAAILVVATHATEMSQEFKKVWRAKARQLKKELDQQADMITTLQQTRFITFMQQIKIGRIERKSYDAQILFGSPDELLELAWQQRHIVYLTDEKSLEVAADFQRQVITEWWLQVGYSKEIKKLAGEPGVRPLDEARAHQRRLVNEQIVLCKKNDINLNMLVVDGVYYMDRLIDMIDSIIADDIFRTQFIKNYQQLLAARLMCGRPRGDDSDVQEALDLLQVSFVEQMGSSRAHDFHDSVRDLMLHEYYPGLSYEPGNMSRYLALTLNHGYN